MSLALTDVWDCKKFWITHLYFVFTRLDFSYLCRPLRTLWGWRSQSNSQLLRDFGWEFVAEEESGELIISRNPTGYPVVG